MPKKKKIVTFPPTIVVRRCEDTGGYLMVDESGGDEADDGEAVGVYHLVGIKHARVTRTLE